LGLASLNEVFSELRSDNEVSLPANRLPLITVIFAAGKVAGGCFYKMAFLFAYIKTAISL
jgi:hypothetical protein